MIVAVVDDDQLQHFIVKSMIATLSESVQVISFFNGEEILEYLKQDNLLLTPDVILLDLRMPLKDGWEFLEEFPEVKPTLKQEVKIFICTSSIDPQDSTRASDTSGLIRKPLRYEDLSRIISGE